MDIKQKAAEMKYKATEWVNAQSLKAQYFYWSHREECILGLNALVALGGGAIKYGLKRQNHKESLKYEDRKIRYDPSTGARWRLKRNLTNKEELYIQRQRQKGVPMGDILEKLRVLK